LSVKIKQAEVAMVILGVLGIVFESFPLMLLVLFLLGLQATFFGPIKYSLIPHYSTKEQLIFSNALISSGTFCAILIGTIAGGLAVSFHGNYSILIIALIVVALLGLHFAKKLPPESQQTEEKKLMNVDWNLYTSTRDIVKLVFKNPMVALLIVGLSWFWFMGAGLLSLMPLIAKDVFNGTEMIATMMLFTFTIGMGIGPFVLEKLTKGKVKRWVIPLSLVAMTMVIFDLSYVIKLANKESFSLMLGEPLGLKEFFDLNLSIRVVIDLFLLSFCGGMFTVPQFAELQRITADNELSRIIAGNNIINSLAMVTISVILMFFHQQKYSLSLILGILGFFNIGMCIALLYFYKEEFNKLWGF
jgi:MFS family permease